MSPHVTPIAVQAQVICQKFDEKNPGIPLQSIKEVRQGPEFPSLYTQGLVLHCENLLGHAKRIWTER